VNANTKRSLYGELKLIARGTRLCFKVWNKGLKWMFVADTFRLFSPYFNLYMTSLIVTGLTDLLIPGGSEVRADRLFLLAGITVLGNLLLSLAGRLLDAKKNVHNSDSWRRDTLFYLNTQNRMQYDRLEDPEITVLREKIWQAKNATGHGLQKIYWNISGLTASVFDLAASFGITVSLFRTVARSDLGGILGFINSPLGTLAVIAILLFIIGAKTVVANRYTQKINFEMSKLADSNARAGTYMGLFDRNDMPIFKINRLAIREMETAFGKSDWLINSHRLSLEEELIIAGLDSVLTVVLLVFVATKAYLGVIGIGSFILYNGTVRRFTSAFSDIIQQGGTIFENNNTLAMLFEFLDQPSDMYRGSLAVEKREDIKFEVEFKNVSFKYPGTERFVLKNVSAKIDVGKKLAIVGENGSGKSTFIKLLCRLYDPTEGQILLNGIDVTRYKYNEYMDLFSVVFQDYMLFQFSIARNIAASETYDSEEIESIMRRLGLGELLDANPRGIETPLGQQYDPDGINISGGESQKIALARALYKNAPFLVLDEPTAALDPLAEADIYARFNDIAIEKTAIYISHRLSSCRFCDEILVFHDGEIIQRGSHDELVSADGKYSELWNAQAKYYK